MSPSVPEMEGIYATGEGAEEGGRGHPFLLLLFVCVTSFERQSTPLCVDSKVVAFVGSCYVEVQQLLFLLCVCV